jgi:hypothetical protein
LKDKDYATIVSVAERLPEETIQEDQNLLMYYDISLEECNNAEFLAEVDIQSFVSSTALFDFRICVVD